jgi:hypothetical protein
LLNPIKPHAADCAAFALHTATTKWQSIFAVAIEKTPTPIRRVKRRIAV